MVNAIVYVPGNQSTATGTDNFMAAITLYCTLLPHGRDYCSKDSTDHGFERSGYCAEIEIVTLVTTANNNHDEEDDSNNNEDDIGKTKT